VGNTAHTVDHVVDRDVGGRGQAPWILALGSMLVLAALVERMRQLGWVAGEVTTTAAVKRIRNNPLWRSLRVPGRAR
jgi:hypothetical protein